MAVHPVLHRNLDSSRLTCWLLEETSFLSCWNCGDSFNLFSLIALLIRQFENSNARTGLKQNDE